MHKLILISAILSISALQAAGQLHPLIQSDRPGQAQTPIAVGKHYIQWQQGYEMGQIQRYNGFNPIVDKALSNGLSQPGMAVARTLAGHVHPAGHFDPARAVESRHRPQPRAAGAAAARNRL